MHFLPTRLDLALGATLLLLGGCFGHSTSGNPASHAPVAPSSAPDQAGTAGSGNAGNPATGNSPSVTAQELTYPLRMPVSYPPMALDYLIASLRDPATGKHAPLSQSWESVSSLSNASSLAGPIGEQVKLVATGPVPPLIAAWLNTSPEDAAPWVVTELKAGHYIYLPSLANQPVVGRIVLKQLDLANAPAPLSSGIISLLRSWEPLTPVDEALVKPLASATEPGTRLRAIGYLMSIGKATDGQINEIKDALASDKNSQIQAGSEACRICQDERLVSALITRAALIPLGDIPTGPAEGQHDPTALYTAYALSFLPGAQAKLLRTKLLQTSDSQVRWQARLGELLHGNSAPWYEAVLKAADDDRGLWLTLQPDGVVSPELLDTYKKAAASPNGEIRLKAAVQLNRYGAYASEKTLSEVVTTLMHDKNEQIATQAWHTAALLHLDGFGNEAQKMLDDESAPPAKRLAAAFYELKLAEPATLTTPAPDKTAGAGGSK